MDTILQGVEGVICYIDDILVTGINKDNTSAIWNKCSHDLRNMDSG